MNTTIRNHSRRAPGFTLVEVLIVITVILILAALLLPAINSILKRAEQTRSINEITQISHALEAFKERYGAYPPSRIRLRENTKYAANPAHPDFQFDQHSIAWLRRIWPNIVIETHNNTSGNPATTANPAFIWFFDDSATTTRRTYDLEGDECLVFFLGGVAEKSTSGTIILQGFTRNPQNPSGIKDATVPASLNRDDPLYQFDAGRLYIRTGTQIAPVATTTAQDFNITTRVQFKLPSYRARTSDAGDPRPIAYFSSYEGRGYRPYDCDLPNSTNTEDTLDYFQMTWPVLTTTTSSGSTQHAQNSLGPNPYLQLDPIHPPQSTSIVDPVTGVLQPYKPDSYQLISPGPDGIFGAGGYIQPKLNSSDPAYDNISNVGDGRSIGEYSQTLQ